MNELGMQVERRRPVRLRMAGLLVVLASIGLADADHRATRESASSLDYIEVVEQDLTGVTLILTIPPDSLRVETDESAGRFVRLPGVAAEIRPGFPDLPVLVTSIAVPEGARLTTDTTLSAAQRIAVAQIRPVGRIDPATRRVVRQIDARAYEGGLVPQEPVQVEELRFRELRLARITFHPVRYASATGELLVVSNIRVRFDFEGSRGFGRVQGRMNAAARVVEEQLLNRDSLRDPLAAARPVVRATAIEKTPTVANGGVKIHVDQPGLVRVTWADLQAIGFNAQPVDPRRLQVSFRGTPVPSRVLGEIDGSFDSGDAIEFYGVVTPSRYSAESVYQLEQGTTPGLRFPTVDATPGGAVLATEFQDTIRYEDGNSIYTTGEPAEEGDPHFYWAWFENAEGDPRVTSVLVPKLLAGLGSGTDALFRASFFGRTDPPEDPDHRVRFRVNGNVIGLAEWNGKTFHTAELPFDAALLRTTTNQFRLDWRFLAFPDIYYLDWIEIEYPRLTAAVNDALTITAAGGAQRYRVTDLVGATDSLLLDVTDPFAPSRLEGAVVSGSGPYSIEFEVDAAAGRHYLIAGDNGRVPALALELDQPSSLRTTAQGADLIVVVPDGWESALQPLVDYRRQQGWRVVLAKVTDVADEFGGGNVDDLAIREFVAWAYDNYEGPPVSHLLLVGEPNLDPLDHLQQPSHHHLMPTHFGVTAEQGETPTDTWFGAVAGDDLLPDVAVARFSVRTVAQAQQLVTKTIDYENRPWDPTWGKTLIHVASDEAQFEEAFDHVAPVIPSDFVVKQQYRAAGATTVTIREDINLGALLVSFIGHGNIEIWADLPGGSFWHVSHVSALTNVDKPAFVLALNCLNGMIADPETPDSMGEVFHNLPDTGAIAVWSPSALGFLRQYDELQQVLYDTLFIDGVRNIGAATTGSLIEAYLTRPFSLDAVKELVLLADPTTRLATDCTATDVTCDGIDDDCDGEVDEEFGSTTTYCGLGACQSTGMTECDAGGIFTDTCTPGAAAQDDASCNDVDDDCDGLIDEDYPVTTTFCGIGGCSNTGKVHCFGAQVEDTCVPLEPAADDATCDGVDDDCDSIVDEDFTASPVECGQGICVSSGMTQCDGGVLTDDCIPGEPGPDDASCNATDEDCDGMVDEEFEPDFVSCGRGACFRTEPMECVNGMIDTSCTPGKPAPDDRTCDGVDDNCDGFTDEGYVAVPTTCGVGACERTGETYCFSGSIEDNCLPGGPAPSDPTCNGIDEDCDGLTDEDYPVESSSCGVGECVAAGTIKCGGGTVVDDCTPRDPTAETCDFLDNDCDGDVDEDAIDRSTWHLDDDLDGYGDPQSTQQSCVQPPGFIADGTDCDDGSAEVWATPGEVRMLRFDNRSTLGWDLPVEPGGSIVATEILRSSAPEDFGAAATCIDGGHATVIADAGAPPFGVTWFYLARATNGCPSGTGSLGVDSMRTPRIGRSCPF